MLIRYQRHAMQVQALQEARPEHLQVEEQPHQHESLVAVVTEAAKSPNGTRPMVVCIRDQIVATDGSRS